MAFVGLIGGVGVQSTYPSHSGTGRYGRRRIGATFYLWRMVCHSQIYAAGVLFFAGNCALAGIQAFLPTIIASFGFSKWCSHSKHCIPFYLTVLFSGDAVAQILTVPPYAVAIVLLCFSMYVSDRLQRRGVFLLGSSVLAGLGYVWVGSVFRIFKEILTSAVLLGSLLLAFPTNDHVRYFATFCTCAGTFPTIALILTWCA